MSKHQIIKVEWQSVALYLTRRRQAIGVLDWLPIVQGYLSYALTKRGAH